jgi:3-isopropylmalate/(R)-2-methylmalate dehydratase large subunit
MGMTIAEKILAVHCGAEIVRPGEYLMPKIDMLFGNELGTALALAGREELLRGGVYDPERVAIIPDHFTPNKDVQAAEQCKMVRRFARDQGLRHYYEVGRMGIEHVLMHEKGLVSAGELIIGADSHTCTHGALGALAIGVGSTDFFYTMLTGESWLMVPQTISVEFTGTPPEWVTAKDMILTLIGRLGEDGANYKVLEFCGDAVKGLNMDERFTLCNMAVEAGAKTAIIEPDEVSLNYLANRALRPPAVYTSDMDAAYCERIVLDASRLEPVVACPHSPANVEPLSKLAGRDLPVDQVFVGGCTNGRLTDLRVAAEMLRGCCVHPDVRMIVVPGSQDVYLQAMAEGLLSVFIEAGAVVGTPSCGACIGGHAGLLAGGERCVSTTNRNFRGRMGHVDSEVYLASVPVAAATAIKGVLAAPWEVL